MDYRRHRMGAAHGAKGEITSLAMGSKSVTGNKRSSMKVREKERESESESEREHVSR